MRGSGASRGLDDCGLPVAPTPVAGSFGPELPAVGLGEVELDEGSAGRAAIRSSDSSAVPADFAAAAGAPVLDWLPEDAGELVGAADPLGVEDVPLSAVPRDSLMSVPDMPASIASAGLVS